MAESILKQLEDYDRAVLAGILKRDVNHLEPWSVEPLSHTASVETTGGLYRLRGSGESAWSLVVKVVARPQEDGEAPHEMGYWRRELCVYRSGLPERLPGGVRGADCFYVADQTPGGWLWLEDLSAGMEETWTLAEYERGARLLGRMAGGYLTRTTVPDATWLCRSIFRDFYADGGWWQRFIDPHSATNAWQVPAVQALYDEVRQADVLRIWAEKERMLYANEQLPRVLCHNDAHRRNLALKRDVYGVEQLAVIDWSFCGVGALGNDLGEMVGTTLSHFDVDPSQAQALEEAVLSGYLDGLRQAGCLGLDQQARLGYALSLALWWGGTLPHAAALTLPPERGLDVEQKFGRTAEAVLPGWIKLADFALERAEQARFWMRAQQLG